MGPRRDVVAPVGLILRVAHSCGRAKGIAVGSRSRTEIATEISYGIRLILAIVMSVLVFVVVVASCSYGARRCYCRSSRRASDVTLTFAFAALSVGPSKTELGIDLDNLLDLDTYTGAGHLELDT